MAAEPTGGAYSVPPGPLAALRENGVGWKTGKERERKGRGARLEDATPTLLSDFLATPMPHNTLPSVEELTGNLPRFTDALALLILVICQSPLILAADLHEFMCRTINGQLVLNCPATHTHHGSIIQEPPHLHADFSYLHRSPLSLNQSSDKQQPCDGQ